MRESTFLILIIGISILLSITVSVVLGQGWPIEEPKKTIKFLWSWNETPAICFYTNEYQYESVTAIMEWNKALNENFVVSYQFLEFGGDVLLCNVFVFFYENPKFKDGSTSHSHEPF